MRLLIVLGPGLNMYARPTLSASIVGYAPGGTVVIALGSKLLVHSKAYRGHPSASHAWSLCVVGGKACWMPEWYDGIARRVRYLRETEE